VTSNRRQRALARAKAERQAEKRARRERRQRLVNIVIAIVAVVVVAGGVVTWFALTRGSNDAGGGGRPTPSPTASPTADPSPTSSPTASPTSTVQPDPECSPPPAIRTSDITFSKPGDAGIVPGRSYDMVLDTNCGRIVISTLPDKAPETVNSMLFLTEQKYFDLTACHRLTTAGIFVLQCGDPEATGAGGPGYTVPDENVPADVPDNYPAGTVAMANAGPGTAGSQFFIVYDDSTLPSPSYTVWGTVTEGLDVVRRIAEAGVQGGGSDGPPAQQIVIEQATATSTPAG
jgi:peptidyl-prolyl cis-trans isomerase B (cyclophilin B)